MSQQTPPGWYADPSGSGQQRYWDGRQWTQHVHPGAGQVPQQRQSSSKLEQFAELNVDSGHSPERVQRQVQHQARTAQTQGGGGTIFTEPILVVNQKAKLVEISSEYTVYDQNGQQLAAVVQVGQSAIKKAIRFMSKYDQFMTHKLEIRDAHERPLMRVTRPAKLMKSRVIVERGDGMPLGEIVQQNVMGKKTFSMTANGQEIGQIRGEDWFSWELGIFDNNNVEIARITKTWEGLGKALFTTADNYVLKLHQRLPDPLLSMVVASALTVDVAIHQDSN